MGLFQLLFIWFIKKVGKLSNYFSKTTDYHDSWACDKSSSKIFTYFSRLLFFMFSHFHWTNYLLWLNVFSEKHHTMIVGKCGIWKPIPRVFIGSMRLANVQIIYCMHAKVGHKCFIITNLITQSNWWECQNFVFIDPWRVGWRRTKQVQPLKVAEKYNDPNEWSRLQSGSMKSGANMTVSKWLIMVRWVYSQKWGNIWATRVFLAWTKFTLNTWFGYERVWWECSHRNLNHERWGVHI